MKSVAHCVPIFVVCAFLACLFPGLCGGTIIIDDFESGTATLTAVNANATYYATQSGLATSHVAGGVRHMDLFTYSAPASIAVGSGVMDLNTRNTSTYSNITYNANAASPGGAASLNLNLSGYERFEVTFSRVDRSLGFLIRVQSGTKSGTSYVTATVPGVVTAALTGFSNYGLINWSDIDLIRLEVMTSYQGGGSAHTESISDFRVVPEPATAGLLVLGSLLAGLRRKRG